jgi:succinate dehydrogenase / fumarate reductase cytochrome b subunit
VKDDFVSPVASVGIARRPRRAFLATATFCAPEPAVPDSPTWITGAALLLTAPSRLSYLKHTPLDRRRPVTEYCGRFLSLGGWKKNVVAITGIILILFVIGHLLGYLQIFLGPDWINGYSQHLRDLGPLLWVIRLFLLAAVVVHIYVTIQLAIENRRARPQAYVDREYVKATFASRHMVMSGLIVLAFIVYHIAHFTVRVTDPRFGLLKADPLGHYDVYSMMVYGFQNYYVSGFYFLASFCSRFISATDRRASFNRSDLMTRN